MNDISDKDKKDWENFISSKEKLIDKDFKKNSKNLLKTKTIDLHGYTLDEANIKVEEFIKKSYFEHVRKLVVVTGKGLHSQNEKNPFVSKDLSILKFSIPHFIKKNFELMKLINNFEEATIKDGGSGAFYIYLKKKI